MKRLLFFLIAMIFAIQGWTQVDIQIGNGTTNYYDPLPGWYGWNRSAYLYKADEIGVYNGGTINSISFQIQSASTGTTAQLNVYIKDTSITQMPSLASSNWNGLKTGATLVYQSTAFAGSPTGWITITFTTPYVYNGTSNLVVYVEGQGCSTTGGCTSQCYNHVSTASHWYCRKDSSAPDDNLASVSSTGQENNRANIKFNITPNGDFCYPPDNLLTSNITTSSADLAWTTNTSGNSWIVQYKQSLDATWSTDNIATSGSYSLQGLNTSTAYDVRIKSICATDESSWRTISFRTACGAISSFPWNEGFESTPWSAAVVPGNALAPDCWFNINGGYSSTSYIWRRTATAAYVHSGTGAAQMYSGGATYATNDWLISPPISLTGSERLRFWAKGYSTYVDQIGVRIYDITTNTTDIALVTDTTLFTEIMPNTLVSATAWTEYEINLSQYSGDYRIAFVRNTTGGYYLNIDDVSISIIPSCIRPSLITSTSNTENTIDLSWTNGNASDVSWYIYYAPTGTTIFDSVLANSNPFTLSGLSASTGYDIYMRTDCGSDLSEATSVSTFYTACGAITSFPWTEGFELNWTPAVAPGNQFSPSCWTVIDKGGVNGTYQYWWKKGTTPAHTGSGHAVCYTDYGTTGHNDWLITPQLSLTGDERLRFWAMRSSTTSTEPDEISVFISDGNITTLDTTGMGIMGNMTGFTQIFTQMLPVGDWQQYEVNLNQYTGTRYIAFVRQNTPDGYNLRLDDVSVEPIPACARPTQLANIAVSQTTADFSWLPGHTGDASWYLYYKTSTATTYDSIQVTSNPYQLTNLTSNSTYNAYMKTDCSTELSEASPIITFHTPCDAILALPYTEAFDTYGTGSPIIPTCWSKMTTYSTYPYISTTNSSAPGSLYFYTSSGSYNIAVTPPFDATIPLNTLLATFKMKKSNATSNVIVGVMTNPNDPSTFDTVAIVAPISTTAWETLEVNFSSYQGAGQYIAFKAAYNTTTNYFYIDDLSVDLIPTCARASALTFSAIDTSSALVSWTAGNPTDASWWFYWKPTSSTTYDSLLISSNPYTITDLTPNTSYNVYITTDCSTLLSEPSNVFSFRTACAPIITLPYIENFDTYGTGSTIFPSCWNKITTYSTYPYISTTNSSAPGALYFYTSSGTYNIAVAPIIDASIPINTLMASFKLRKSNATSNVTVGVMTDPTNASTFDSITTVSPSTIGAFEQFEVNLNNYTGTGQYIAFKVAYNTTTNYIYLDDLSIGVIPLCPNTYSLAVASATSSDITLNWSTMNSVGQGWEVSYGAIGTGFDPSTGTIIPIADAVGVPPYTITGLTPSTPYSFAVRQACGGNWSNIVTVNTMGLPAVLPYSCDFEDVNEQNSWSISNGAATNKWFIGTAVSATPITGNSLYISNDNGVTNSYNDVSISTVVASRLIEFDGAGGYTLTFNSRLGGESTYDYIKVYVVNADTTYVGDASVPYYGTTTYSVGEVLYNGTNAYFNNVSSPTTVNNHSIVLPYQGVAGTVKKLMFVWRNDGSGGTPPPASIDNISITPITCAAPALTISNIAQTTADASWTSTASDAAWWLYWKEASATDYDSVYVTGTPSYSFSTLIANTPYNSYVRLDCGTDLSSPSVIVNFRTACAAIVSFPYAENFDTYGTGTSIMPSCWTRTTTYADRPYVNTGGHTTNCLYFYAGTAGTYNIAAMNPIDATIPVNTLMASFYYKNLYASDKLIIGVMTDPTNAATFDSITTIIAPTTATWAPYEVNFSAYTGIGTYIAFKNIYTTTTGYAYVDDLVIDIIPTCSRPTAVSTSNGVGTSVDVTFTPGNLTDAAWYVFYKPTSATTWDSVYTSLTTTNLVNLTLQTTYQIYAKTVCGDGTNSNASQIITYTTPCYLNPINTFPWTEGFENGLTCWAAASSGTAANYFWQTQASGSSPSCSPHGGSTLIRFNSYNISDGSWATIASPALDFTTDMKVSFWMYKSDNYSSNYAEGVRVFVNSTPDTVGATLLGHVLLYSAIPQWDSISYQIPTGTLGTKYIIIKGLSEYGDNIFLDDVTVDVSVSVPCPDPTAVAVTNITTTTADVAWTAGGSETTWEVRLGTTGTPVVVTTPTYQLPGLAPGTNYTVYVRANCGTGYSAWVASAPFTTTSVLTVVTLPQTSVTQTSAILNGTVTPGTASILSQGFEWKETSATTWTVQPATGTTITYTLPLLTPNTSYTYRAFAMTATDTVRGIDIIFTTLAVVPPTVVTTAVTSIQPTTATFNGTTAQGTDPINGRGFEYKLTATSTWTGALDLTATGTTTIQGLATSLTASTQYDVRAYVIIGTTRIYGNVVNFTTLQNVVTPPTVVTSPVTNITQTSADLNGTVTQGTNPVLTQGFEWRLANATSWTQVQVIGALTHPLTGLTASTTYEFRAYATTAIDTTYGLTLNFTTQAVPVVLGNVTTQGTIPIGAHDATLNGTLVSVGNALSNIKVGFVYSTMANPMIGGLNVITDTVPYTVGMTSFNDPIIGLQSNTSYFCKAYITNSAGTSYGDEITFITLGLENPENQGFSVSMYPNPATNTIKLVVSGVVGEAKIVISDVQGRIINTINAKSVNGEVEQTIDVNNLAKGVYYVRIQNTTTSRTQKLIVQ